MEKNKLGIKIIDWYIIRRFLGTYIFAIGLIIMIVVIFDAAEKIDKFLENNAPWSDIIFTYYLNFIPYFINQFSGLFTFIAVIFFTSKMAYDTEIIAILSCGVSFKRMLWPYFLAALLITILNLVLSLMIIPEANGKRVAFENDYLRKNPEGNFEQHIFRQIEPGTFAYIRGYNNVDKQASFFSLETYADGTIVSSLSASGATFDPETKHWRAAKYLTRTFDRTNEILVKGRNLDTMINLSTNELGDVDKLVQTMNASTLTKFIRQQKDKGSDMVQSFEVELYNRYAYPMATFVLTLIGVSLSSRKVRGGTGLHIGIGITLCFSYILFMKFVTEFAKGGVLPAYIAVWIPSIAFAFIAIYLYKKAPK